MPATMSVGNHVALIHMDAPHDHPYQSRGSLSRSDPSATDGLAPCYDAMQCNAVTVTCVGTSKFGEFLANVSVVHHCCRKTLCHCQLETT